MKDPFNLKGKTAIVTGGNGGIGKGIARGLASAGCQIVVAGRDEEKTARTVQEIREEFGIRALGIQADVAQEEEIRLLVKQTLESFGRIDIMVNNAGMNKPKMPQDYELREWDEIMGVNLKGAFLCCREVYPAMKTVGGGKIINIGSMLSIFGLAVSTIYGASKGGVVQLTRGLAVAWAKDNIQVNAILPGYINTDLTRRLRQRTPEINEKVISRTPVGRWGEPDDLAGTAIYLASSASNFVTGAALPVDGGFSVMI
ncbi:MAG: kduD [Deltaproteobacteria bacterium]|nr:kduD [Deltaproteobacteria bacterium]